MNWSSTAASDVIIGLPRGLRGFGYLHRYLILFYLRSTGMRVQLR